MFVRFRASAHRLNLSIVETRRRGAKVCQEHVGSLGSYPLEPSMADRIGFWRRLFERLDNLSNRIATDDQAKILDAVNARIPAPTVDDTRSQQLENAKRDARSGDFYVRRTRKPMMALGKWLGPSRRN